MKLTRRTLLLGTGAALLFGSAAIAQELPQGGTVKANDNTKGPQRIAFMAFQNNPFWIPVTEGAKAAKDYLAKFNTTVDYVDLGDTLSAEVVIAGIESAIAQKYNGIVIVPVFDGTERAINEAVAQGIPVVNIIAEGNAPSDRLLFIGQDANAAGAQLGEFIGKKLGGKGKVGVITGYFGAAQHTNRMNGAVDYLKKNYPDIQIVGPFENQDKAEIAYSLVQDMYTANPDLSLVYVTAGGPFGAAKAIKDLGLTGKVGVVGFDHTPENVEYLKTGEMWALIDQAPFQQAFDSTVLLHNYLIDGKAPAEKVIAVKGNILTPDGPLK
ncbi:ABC transporter substrate-binding protein [Kaistia algarum]|uniref:sugar ABC transporter substrate-binding protein n=1 Tax=Kaistia algarum TaxID=2083279 RepID=UPI000CE8C629|nr:sugar ABC transporter substrate-binding protein [Kaistia algarum]MCX5512690.1 sugar ABC transporter substrate-binding protein [Kaistia algarum]PPE81801.1 ABC transporter substrate-binding protein [Kaistia algarum]